MPISRRQINNHYCHTYGIGGTGDECSVEFSGGMADVLANMEEWEEQEQQPNDYPDGKPLYLGEDSDMERYG